MRAIFLALLSVSVGAAPVVAQPPAKIPILFDFDIGEDIDDTFALATILASPELDLRGVTTVGEDSYKRAQMACRFLAAVGSGKIPVAAGLPAEHHEAARRTGRCSTAITPRSISAIRNRRRRTCPDFLYQQLKATPGELTIVAVGPLTNIAELLTDIPIPRRR